MDALMSIAVPKVIDPSKRSGGNGLGFLVAILLLFGLILIFEFGQGFLTSVGGLSLEWIIGYGGGILFILLGLIELLHEANRSDSRGVAFLVPSLFVLIGFLLVISTYLTGTPGAGTLPLASVEMGLLVVLVVGSLILLVLDHYEATHVLLSPTISGSTPFVVRASGSSVGSKLLTLLVLVVVIVVLYLLYIIVQDVLGILHSASCGFIFCNL